MTSPLQEYEQQPLVSLEEAVQPLLSLVPGLTQMFETIQIIDEPPVGSLSSNESASIMLYTLKWKTPQTSFQYFLNEIVRSQNHQQIQPWLLYLRLFFHALSRLPLSSFSTVYRALKIDIGDEYTQGNDFIWWDFVSCTSSLRFPDEHPDDRQSVVMFIIECNSVRDISPYSLDTNTDEILLYPGRKFRVMSSLDNPNQTKLIQLREVHQHNPSFRPPQNYSAALLRSLLNQYPPNFGIDLNRYELSESDIEIVIEHVIINKQCSKLLLSQTRLTAGHVSILANRLAMNTTLKFLNLSYNDLSDRGVQSLMKILEQNQCKIETLSLHATGITDRTVEDLAKVLKKNTTLRWLHLGRNQISDHSIPLLTEVLTDHNQTLRALELSFNQSITHLSADALANMLEKSPSLETFWINDCQLLNEDKKRLEKIVQNSRRFFLLFVHTVPIRLSVR